MDSDSIQTAVTGATGALGVGGAAWLCRMLFARVLSGYDQLNAKQDEKIDQLTKEISQSRERIAVLDAFLEDTRRLRKDMESSIGSLRGEIETRTNFYEIEVEGLRRDLFIAHGRIRMLAEGETDFTGLKIPEKINKR